MLFSTFAQFLFRLETIASRLEITAVLAELYRGLSTNERKVASYLLQGSLVPEYDSMEFQLSTKMIMRSLAMLRDSGESAGLFGETDFESSLLLRQEWVSSEFKKLGDLGLVAKEIKKDTPGETTATIESVYGVLLEIANANGAGSQEKKVRLLTQLLKSLDATSAMYVVRIILGKLRLGFSTMTILDALSWSVHGSKVDHAVLEEAYQKQADIGHLAQVYLSADSDEERARALAGYCVTAGVPVVPQLCQRLATPAEVVEKLGSVYVEPKYDGLRAQIHIFDGQIRVFTRSLEDVSDMFPEVHEIAKKIKAKSVVLDGEAIGYDRETGRLLPFQQTITRKRKHDIALTAGKTPITFFVYDVLLIDGVSLIEVPLSQRKARLRELFEDSIELSQPEFIITSDPEELQAFHEHQLSLGLEGVVIKQVASPYQSGRKGWYWVKLKELAGTRGKLTDTIDCVVMGYYFGQGKRTEFGVGAFLVGVRDDESIKTIAKIGTGLSDEQFRELKRRCDVLETNAQPEEYVVTKSLVPAVWTVAGLVVEIAADEITQSPNHSSGVALRFPRLVRFRDDKAVKDSTTLEELKAIAG